MTSPKPLRVAATLLTVIVTYSPIAGAQVSEFLLNNGMKVIVKEDHRAPVAVIQVWYKVGSSYEHDGITGVSHALEHMMFKGTKKHGEGEYSRIIAENGGSENAFTGDDYTTYHQTMEKSRLPISFELEADRMRNLILSPATFEKEIEVVMEERRWRTEDNPNSFLREVAMATAFQTSPYRQPIIGWMADLETMTVEDLRAWYDRWYAPNNATLVVVGDVIPAEVHNLARKHFGPIKKTVVVPSAHRPEVPQNGAKRVVVKRRAEVPSLLMTYKVPGLKSVMEENAVEPWEPYALEVLSGILSGGNSARFASRLVRSKEIASSVRSSYDLTGRLDGLFTISGTPVQGKSPGELEEAVRTEIEDLKNNEVAPQELQRVIAQVVSSDVYERDSAFFQGMILGIFETVGLGWQRADEYVQKIQEVTPSQIQAAARKYLVDDSATIAVLEPMPASNPPGGGNAP